MFHILVTRWVYTMGFVNCFSFDTFTKYDSPIYYYIVAQFGRGRDLPSATGVRL